MLGVNRSGPEDAELDWGQSCAAESQKLGDKYRLLSSEMAKLQAPDLGSRYAANQATRERLTNAYSELSQSWASLKQACAAHGVEIQDLTDPAPRQPSDSNDKTPAPWWETAKDWAASA